MDDFPWDLPPLKCIYHKANKSFSNFCVVITFYFNYFFKEKQIIPAKTRDTDNATFMYFF